MKRNIIWSNFQKEIFRDVKEGIGHTVVEAKAGSAKTTTLIEALKYVPPDKSILLLAFNKKIAEELKEKAPEYNSLEISTLHSFGYRVIRESLGKKIKLDPDKTFKIIRNILSKDKKTHGEKDNFEAIYEMDRAVNLCRNLIVDSPLKIDALLDEFDIQTSEYSRHDFIHRIIWALGESKLLKSTIDFTDMVYFPFCYQLPIPKYDRVFIDEFQDLTPLGQYLSNEACKPNGRIFIAGDTCQVLYKWNGSQLDGMEIARKRLNAKVLSLPVSYRCARNIVFEAQKIVPEITYAPNAPDGEVHRIAPDQVIKLIKPGDFLLSRTNVELITWTFELWRNKIPANIRSREMGIGLTAVIKQSRKKNVPAFLEWLEVWKKEEVERLKAKHRDILPLLDRISCLQVLCEGKNNIEEVKEVIKSLFDDKGKNEIVSLSTIHGAKGLESDSVFVLMSTFRFGDNQEERNCKYVAFTRAKKILYLIQ